MEQLQEKLSRYIKIDEAAAMWGISTRRVQKLCADGKIEGVIRYGRDWMIPQNATRPIDGRTKAGRESQPSDDMPLPRKTPFLYMSDLYRVPGTADEVAKGLLYNHEAEVLFRAEVAYSRGEIDKVYDFANYLLDKHSGFYAILSAGMLLALCAIWKGDLAMWRRAKLHLAEAPAKDDRDRDIISMSITAVDSMLYDVQNFPEWFKIGNFEPLHKDALPAAKVYYAKYLYATGYAVATKELTLSGVQGLSLMAMIPFTVEPMISQAVADETILAELYLRMTCAAIYHSCDRDDQAIRHLDRAIPLALADGFYGLLAEYGRTLGSLLERRLNAVDPEAWEKVNRLYRVYHDGWSKLSNGVIGRRVITTLSQKEREVAKLAAFGLSNAEIAEKLNMSVAGVKQAIKIASEKSGMDRKDFASIL